MLLKSQRSHLNTSCVVPIPILLHHSSRVTKERICARIYHVFQINNSSGEITTNCPHSPT